MRRFLSLTMVAALLTVPLSPVWAVAQSSGNEPMACHRVGMTHHDAHDCDGMPEHRHGGAPASHGVVLANANPENCPMNCCVQGRVQSGTVAAPISLPVPLAVTDKESSYALVMFTSAGFSSHTDRGPPSTQSLA
ncbi:MAG: hypothetical protein LAO20_22755 [Acidobacteriia bacterium]|nr:hypothetical protein [Terriglobia bacterium]